MILKYKISFSNAKPIASGNFGDVYLALNNKQQPNIKYRFNRIINHKQIKGSSKIKKFMLLLKLLRSIKIPMKTK